MTDYEQHVEQRARAIRPEAWVEEPTASFRGMQPKGTSNDDVLKAWWQAYSDQRYDARIRARSTMEADRAAGLDPFDLKAALERSEADCAAARMALRAVASCAPPEADYTSDMMIYQSIALECKRIARQALSTDGGKLLDGARGILDWYDRDGSVGGASDAVEALRSALKGTG